LAVALSLSSGCHTPSPKGGSSFAIMSPERANAVSVSLQTGRDTRMEEGSTVIPHYFSPVLQGDVTLPVYPPSALAARTGEVTVYAQLTIGMDGEVVDIAPSFRVVSIPNAYSDHFFEAVSAAVKRWKFSPAEMEYIEEVRKSGKVSYRFLRSEAISDTVDVKFTFTAPGRVNAG